VPYLDYTASATLVVLFYAIAQSLFSAVQTRATLSGELVFLNRSRLLQPALFVAILGVLVLFSKQSRSISALEYVMVGALISMTVLPQFYRNLKTIARTRLFDAQAFATLLILNMVSTLMTRFDYVIALSISASFNVGLYMTAQSLVSPIMLLPNSFMLWHSSALVQRRSLDVSFMFGFIAMILVSIPGVYILARIVIDMALSPAYHGAELYLWMAIVFVSITTFNNNIEQALIAIGAFSVCLLVRLGIVALFLLSLYIFSGPRAVKYMHIYVSLVHTVLLFSIGLALGDRCRRHPS
jgi:O-antigen/teichoic acid export membrane protein